MKGKHCKKKASANASVEKRKRGAPIGNQNALGNRGGAPIGNQNARKLGIYSRYAPPPYGRYAPLQLQLAAYYAQKSGNEDAIQRAQRLIEAWAAEQEAHGRTVYCPGEQDEKPV